MSTFSKSTFKTLNYNAHRPHYPALFYRLLAEYARAHDPVDTAVDLGCGTGVATYPLLNFCQNVVGVDLLTKMIETAALLAPQRCRDMGVDPARIRFVAGSVESLAYGQNEIFGRANLDLVTAAQCIHWFEDYPTFFRLIARLLKPGATLAYWYYVDPIVVDYAGSERDLPEAKRHKLQRSWQIVAKYLYNDPDFAGPHWEQPGRSILRDHLDVVNQNIPHDLYHDVQTVRFVANIDGPAYPGDRDLQIVMKNLPLTAIKDYLDTNSGYHNYREAHSAPLDIPAQILKEWQEELGWGGDTTVDYVFHTGYTFMRRKQ